MTITNRISDNLTVAGLRDDNKGRCLRNGSDRSWTVLGRPARDKQFCSAHIQELGRDGKGCPLPVFCLAFTSLLFHSYRANSEAVERGLAIAPVSHLAALNHIQLYLNQWLASKEKASRKREIKKEKREMRQHADNR